MNKSVIVPSHESYFLEQGYFFALGFKEGWMVGRVKQKTWATLQPWALGPVAALGNLAAWDEIQDANSRHYLEPYNPDIIYHTFFGVTPTQAQIKLQYPVRTDIGSMLSIARTLTDGVGIIDGYKSPFWGPYSEATELFTVKDQYPAFNIYNPTNDAIVNAMLNFDQRQYTYEIIKDRNLIKDILVGTRRVKKYTLGTLPLQMDTPGWLVDRINKLDSGLLKYSNDVMAGVL